MKEYPNEEVKLLEQISSQIDNIEGGGGGTIDTEMSDTSTNAVQNKVIKKYVDDTAVGGTMDTEMSDSSTNAVQNKVIKEYVDTGLSGKQDTLESGVNIKTVNNRTLLGDGNVEVSSTMGWIEVINPSQDVFEVDFVMENDDRFTISKDYESSLIHLYAESGTQPESITVDVPSKTYLDNAISNIPKDVKVVQWAESGLNKTIPPCTNDVVNTNIPKFTYTLTGQDAIDYAIKGLISYEITDSSNSRLNFMPVCQFTGQNQTELNVRGCVMGSNSKVADKIVAWVLLERR